MYRSLIFPYISYGLNAWGQAAKTHLDKILLLQKRAVHLMNFAKFSDHAIPLFISSNILPLPLLYFKLSSTLMPDVYNKVIPSNISDLFRLHSLCILQGGAEDFRGGSQIFRAKKGGI